MQRTAFSAIVREAGDLAYAVFDSKARMIAQAETGTPGHINCLASCGKWLAEMFEGDLEPGDVLISNDPWNGAGHFFDITVFAPIFRDGRLIGYIGSTNHHTDIGGVGTSIGAADVHEEGLWIPPAKLYSAGKLNQLLMNVIKRNVRTPDLIAGDLAAQTASARAGEAAVIELCERFGLDDLDELADEIVTRSERAMRDAIRACPAGTWEAESKFDISGGRVITLHVRLTIDSERGEVDIDFAGSSPQIDRGINVVLNYTRAYSMFAVRSCLALDLPNNSGSLTPIRVNAPEDSIVNCTYPAPVSQRHVVGMYVPMPIMKALYNAIPDKVVASSPGSPWGCQLSGTGRGEGAFVTMFHFAGGMGARRELPGLSATTYPAGVSAMPLEMIEIESPVVFHRRELRRGSGGMGRMTGGDGQVVEFSVRSGHRWTMAAAPSGAAYAPEGLEGGEHGVGGRFSINGRETVIDGRAVMSPDDVVRLETPGGGGFGRPA
ncbi:hydantoinase B/oxoprolinase family protein [Sphingomonas sp. MG17]|uniref:Hydantoinase B/oxoprolinase family protein n=1 Tax=Sphingomonas tagetis TaxID=2949092 RepID=A0A9X2HL66_9SPHN|nr:hydantoinase B/oxoprolinase family protein [Sphingomonas tagetis]MCP3731219.1 hydantoinase B/oxoprolinase family protein [Sphingomonas tagetis]